ncbi:MAG TPA: helix-turn-helix domain-containing protein [Candidatus Nanoarchaeia archaeon]|nr:helix-turn-helix domain-containing protein [Candidatus Nanoarchaeia archaeon]
MSKFLLVDLNEAKTKKLAETITSATSRKILNHLAETEDDTELNISKELNLPISTVHYHLQKLVEAKLLEIKEFHYSQKGREVNHYRLANKYIIIAPKKVSGLREKLKGILPVTLAVLGISAVIRLVQNNQLKAFSASAAESTLKKTIVADASLESTKMLAEALPPQPDIALWFLIGSLAAIIIHLTYQIIKEKIKN